MECKLMPGIFVPIESCFMTELLAFTSPLMTRKLLQLCLKPLHIEC